MTALPWSRWMLPLALLTPASAAAAEPPPPGADAGPMSDPAALPDITPANTCKKQPMGTRFRITLEREAGLVDLVRWMSSITCTKFVWGANVRDGKVTVVSPEPVTIQQAYAAFYAALETMGLTVEQSGDYLKVVESKDATRQVLPVYGTNQSAPPRDRYVTQLYRPQPGRVDDVVTVVEHLKGERGTVQAVSEVVIITDTGSNIARLMKVLAEVDQPDPAAEPDAIFLHPLRHADPAEMVQIITEIFMAKTTTNGARSPVATKSRGKTKTKGKTKSTSPQPVAVGSTAREAESARVTAVSVDARTKTLIITAPREDFEVVRRLVDRLDQAVPDDAGTLFVLPLRHADPEDVAQVLGSLPTGGRAAGQGQGAAGKSQGTAAPSGVSIGGEIHVTADPATRSLVVMASHRDFLALKRVVETLDRERRQVYIEAYILELSSTNGTELGISGHKGHVDDEGRLSYASSQTTPGTSSMLLDTNVLSGLAAGVLGAPVDIGLGEDVPSFGVMLQALETRDDVNIVADPHLYTADNKMAKMEVGETIPIPNGTSEISGAAGDITRTTYSREKVSLAMEVTPHIGASNAMTLDIKIENNEIASENDEGGPTTTNRVLELEEVLARDGQAVVLGGLVQEKEIIGTRGVPVLSNMPLLGWLFRNRKKTTRKVNLLIVLIPHVLESPEDARRIHERRIRERREFLERETAFERRDLPAHINYNRKAGLLSAVDAEARRMGDELQFDQQAEAQLQQTVARKIAPTGTYELTAAPAAPAVAGGPSAP